MYSCSLSLTPTLHVVVWLTACTGRLTPEKQNRHPLYRRPSEPWRSSERGRQISPGPKFEHRTLQPVASHYTDYTIQTTSTAYIYVHLIIFKVNCR